MSRSERREYFERLCIMRDRYGASPDDRRGVLSIDDVIVYAEAVMVALDEPEWDGAVIESIDETTVGDASAALLTDTRIATTPDVDGSRDAGRLLDRFGSATDDRLD